MIMIIYPSNSLGYIIGILMDNGYIYMDNYEWNDNGI